MHCRLHLWLETQVMLQCNRYRLSIFVIVADIISCVEFDHDGEYLATGDKGGRVVIFERDHCVGSYDVQCASVTG